MNDKDCNSSQSLSNHETQDVNQRKMSMKLPYTLYANLSINVNTIEDLYDYLIFVHIDDIWKVNENQSIRYFTNQNRDCLIAVTNLYSGFTIECIIGETEVDLYRLKSFDNIKKHFIETDKIVLNRDNAMKLINYLEEWCGEYGDNILTINKDEKNGCYKVDWRLEER